MNTHENLRPYEQVAVSPETLAEFLGKYFEDEASPLAEFDSEQVSFCNHFLSGVITDEFGERLLAVRTADHSTERTQRRQRLEQLFLAATLDFETGEEIIYDVTTDVERTQDPRLQRLGDRLGTMAINFQNRDGHTATLTMTSHSITWTENRRELTFRQLT